MIDKSEEYRLMCTCPEIQKDHELKEGDWAYIGCIFLPDIRWYLDNIEGSITIERNRHGHYWINDIPYETSLEIALLKHYMRITHNKGWNGKEWIKI